MRIFLALVLSASPAVADYSTHDGVTIFTEQPCTRIIEVLDSTEIDVLPIVGMTWGFILGYDSAAGGLQGNEETTLIRLRKACEESPETPAAEILESFR